MLENLELTLFSLTTAIYAVVWAWHLRGWGLPFLMVGLRCS